LRCSLPNAGSSYGGSYHDRLIDFDQGQGLDADSRCAMTEKDAIYFELLEALTAGGCALCRLTYKAADSYINALLYEGVVDVPIRDALRSARGLCHRHAWQMAGKRGSVLGTAVIYRDVVNTLARVLHEEAVASRGWRGSREALVRSLAPKARCPACTLAEDAEQRAARTLLRHLASTEIAAAYAAAGGLCLPHFQVVLSHAGSGPARTLAQWQEDAFARLRDELDELIRKHDHRFRGEPITEEEAASWKRAVAAIAGDLDSRNRD
jgi:Family of unknown function (DUF6062)